MGHVGFGMGHATVGNRQMMWLPLHQWQQSANVIDKRGRGQIALNAMQMASSDNQYALTTPDYTCPHIDP